MSSHSCVPWTKPKPASSQSSGDRASSLRVFWRTLIISPSAMKAAP
ncbi:hypothetical protein [Dechloromonas agitata]|nr:hypothetical protein [Dechloromonas agitata]